MSPRKPSRSVLLLVVVGLTFAGIGGQTPARADERSTTAWFEAAKRDEPSLIAFLKRMPKGGDLHNHMGGALYAEYALDNAIQQGLFFDPATTRFERESGPGRVPAAQLLTNDRLLAQFLDAASMRGWKPAVESGHDHFFRTFGIVGSARHGMAVAAALAEVAGRARDQNMQYLELMFAPGGGALGAVLTDSPSVEDPEKALQALQPKLATYVTAARAQMDTLDLDVARRLGFAGALTSAASPVTVRYLISAGRLAPDAEIFALWAAAFTLMKADRRVVGVNLVQPEDHPIARTRFDGQMRLLDFLWRRFERPNVTLHAGELTLALSPPEAMRNRIRRTIEVGRARRVGHAVSVAWEDDLPGLLRKMREEGIAVEICLTSNDVILGVSGDRHPFNLYRRAGVPLTLNTDDEAVSRSNLTMEFVRAVRTYNLSYAEVKALARNSLEYSFLPGASLYQKRDPRRLHPAFAGVRRRVWRPSAEAERLMAGNDRLRVQVRLERALVAFEE
jgi:adenosine deaminase